MRSENNLLLFHLTTLSVPILSYYARGLFSPSAVRVNCFHLLSSFLSTKQVAVAGALFLVLLLYISFDNIVSSTAAAVGMGLLVGGGVFNIFERLVATCVRDYVNFFELFWVNSADIAISVGVLTLVTKVCINIAMSRNNTNVNRQNTNTG